MSRKNALQTLPWAPAFALVFWFGYAIQPALAGEMDRAEFTIWGSALSTCIAFIQGWAKE